MNIEVRLFASLRDLFGAETLHRQPPDSATVAELIASLQSELDERALPRNIQVAVNRRYVPVSTVLHEGDEVALLPPVSGGAPEGEARRFWLTVQPLSLDALAALVTAPDRGGIALFSGTVRGLTDVQATDYLEYQAYAEMATAVLSDIGREVQEKWPQVLDVAIVHRIGRLEVGESSVMIAVAAAHRQGIFDACAYAIERLKEIAPIWKKEVGPDGSYWVEGPGGK